MAIKQLAYAAGAVLLIPSCSQYNTKSSLLLKNISIDRYGEQLMEALADTIIPATDTPGASAISAHLFALMMIDDCYKKEDQKKFENGLKTFDAAVKAAFDKSFTDCSATEKTSFLAGPESKKEATEDVAWFYSTVKKLTIQAYTTSKFYLTKVRVYQLVPGRYYGCVPVTSIS